MAWCDVGAVCINSPTGTQTIDEGGSFTLDAIWKQVAPGLFVFCDLDSAELTAQFKISTDVNYTDMTTTSALKTAQSQPQEVQYCEYGTSCAVSCSGNDAIWTVVANTGSGGLTYNVRVKAYGLNGLDTKYSAAFNVVVNAPVVEVASIPLYYQSWCPIILGLLGKVVNYMRSVLCLNLGLIK